MLNDPTGHNINARYELGRELGRGEFGITYMATDLETGDKFACKSISKKKLRTTVDIKDVRREVKIMKHLPNHSNIVTLRDTFEDDNAVHIVMESCSIGLWPGGIIHRESMLMLSRQLWRLFRRAHAKDCLAMEISQDEFHQNKTCEPGAVAGCIENGNEDSKFKSGSPIVEAEGIDAFKFTSLVCGTSFDLLKCLTATGNSNVLSEEESKGYVVTNDGGFPNPYKSTCPLTISEVDLSKSGTIMEGNGFNVENNDNAEEKSLQHDDGDFTVHKLTPLVNGNEDELSKCLGSIEEKVSGVKKDHGNFDTAVKYSLSKERKKSKYLCYPFINLGKESKVLPLLAE